MENQNLSLDHKKACLLLFVALLAAGCASTVSLPYEDAHEARFFRIYSTDDRNDLIEAARYGVGRIVLVRELDAPDGKPITGELIRLFVQHHPSRVANVDVDVARTADMVAYCFPSSYATSLPKVFPHWTGRLEAYIAADWFALYPTLRP